mgnify:CR=1 FL=1
MIKDRVLIIDGLNLFTRHYIAHPGMSENGEQVGGTVGFFNNLSRLIRRCMPEKVYVVWEGGGSRKKRDLYSEYKKGSKPQRMNRYYDDIPDTQHNKNNQLKNLISLLRMIPVVQVYVDDAEADDIIGYLCNYTLKEKNKIIVSSDHDYYQLINKKTIIWSPTLKAFVNDKKVIQRYNVHPNNFCLAKCIVGDKSDNIPGVKGVGYKVLTKCLDKFSQSDFYDMESVFLDVAKMKENFTRKFYNDVLESKDLIKRNWKLVLLDSNNLVYKQTKIIDESIENYQLTWNNIEAHKFLNKLGIKNIDLLSSSQIFNQLKKG